MNYLPKELKKILAQIYFQILPQSTINYQNQITTPIKFVSNKWFINERIVEQAFVLNNINLNYFIMPNIELSDIVKHKLDILKETSGSKTYSDTINFCLLQVELLKQNQELLKEIRSKQNMLTEIKDILNKRNFTEIFLQITKEILKMSDSDKKKLLEKVD